MPQNNPRISVVLCVRDDWRILRLLASLEQQTLPASEFEVIVVATGAEDYGSFARRSPISIREVGSAVARLPVQRNLGLAEVRAEYYATTDADCVADPAWLATFLQAFEVGGTQTVGLGGAIHKYSERTLTQRHGITIDDGQKGLNYLPALHLPYVTGANSAYRTSAVRRVGMYDEAFVCGDDVDLSYRLQLEGGSLGIAANAIVRHEDRETLVAHYRRFRGYAVDQALLFKKYQPQTGRRWHLNRYPWTRLRMAGGDLLSGLPEVARGDWTRPARALATIAEATGVVVGDVQGSIKHGTLYI